MSLINKMLQDLDKRHAADGSGKTLTQQLRPVAAQKNWKRIMWEIGAGLLIGAGWAAWVFNQVSPRSIVTDLVFQTQAKRPRPLGSMPTAAEATPAPVQAAVAQAQPATAAPASPVPAEAPASAAQTTQRAGTDSVDMFKLATEIGTPFREKRSAVKAAPERAHPAEAASVPPAGKKGRPVHETVVQAAAAKTSPTHIDKRVRTQTPAERAEEAFRVATGFLNQGRVAEAIDGYRSALQQDAGHAPARQALVGLLLENRRFDEAQQCLQEGLNLNPERPSYAMLLARILVERGDLQGAHDLLRRHAGSAAGDAEYQAFDAAVLQRLGRHKEAVTAYQTALKLVPKAGLWWMGMGISLQADERGAEALEAFQRAKSVGGLSPALVAFVDQRMKQLQ